MENQSNEPDRTWQKENLPSQEFQPQESQTQFELKNEKRISWKIWIITVSLVIGLASGAYFYFNNSFFSKQYGGETPGETLNLLIDALEKGDTELASKYFWPDDDSNLRLWEDGWRQAKEEGRLPEIIAQLKQMQPNPKNSSHAGDFKYVIRDENGLVIAEVNFELDEETNVWKIESL